jgi:mRNA interferase MazF
MTKYRRGMVVLTLFPNPDLITAKRRPALAVQANNLNTGLEQVIIAMITTSLSRDRHRSRVRINKVSPEGKSAGILTDSVIMTDNLATVRCVEIDRAIGILPSMVKVDRALKTTLGLKQLPSSVRSQIS